MKKYSILFFLLCLSLQLNAQSSAKKCVIISEIMYDTPLNEQIAQSIPYSNGEYIEIFNLEYTPVDLTGWKLTGGGKTEIYEFPENTVIEPRSTVIIAYQYNNSGFTFSSLYSFDAYSYTTVLYQRKIILSNSGETVSIIDNTGTTVDYITYDGTSNKTKPDRLSAPNDDDIPGDNCKSLNRTRVMCDDAGNVIFSPSHWVTEYVSPFEVSIDSPLDKPSKSKTYVLETTYTNPDSGTNSVTYYDGLGRPIQVVDVGASPVLQQSVVTFIEYDCMGRNDSISYLPYVASSQSSKFRRESCAEQLDFYRNYAYDYRGGDSSYPFSRKEYDKSGLGLILKQGAPGSPYQLDAHPTTYQYGFNGTWGSIRRYGLTDNGGLAYRGTYLASQLTAKATMLPTEGENKMTTIEYYDPDGNMVAKEQYISSQDRRITYYVYDDLGRQRYILPPTVDITATTQLEQLTDKCFYMEYDEYGHVCKQYIPGASYVLSLYDKRGRLAMTQDGEQRKTGKWSFTKYDNFDRPIMTGIYSGGTYESHKAALASQTVFGENVDRAPHCYTNKCYPVVDNSNVLTVTYYDNNNWIPDGEDEDRYVYRSDLSLGAKVNNTTTGQIRAKKAKVLGTTTLQWLTTVMYYDEKYRVIQTISDMYPEGMEIVSNAYDYAGNVTEVLVRQELPAGVHEYRKWFSYDQHGRLLSIDQQITGDTENNRVTIVRYTYDELGRATEKKLHNSYETWTYGYDIMGTNTRGQSSLFGFNVYTSRVYDSTTPRYDGKPVNYLWHRSSGTSYGYKYSYDTAGQIATSKYGKYESGKWQELSTFNEQGITYDKNGNILKLKRTDEAGNALHDLSYTYKGNQLTQLNCNGSDYTGYTYDAVGNLTYDPYAGVNFEYNELNLPSRIFGSGKEIRYIYNAEGQKLGVLSDGSFTYYRDVMVYGGNQTIGEQLEYILHPEGMTVKEGDKYTYKYLLSDYMGNVRSTAVADKTSGTLQEEQATDYYPFGLAYSYNNLHKNRYLFSGKELQDASVGRLGFLGLYDFGARHYNPMLGRWFNTDPALQTTNPYLFCGNAPTAYIDKDGRFFWWLVGAAALAGSYFGGSAANDNWNPFQWDWTSGKTWGGFLGGAIQGAFSGAALAYGVSAITGPFFTVGQKFSTFGKIMRWTTLGLNVAKGGTTIASLINNFDNGMDIIRGNYSYSGNNFMDKVLDGISRGTVERIQQSIGYTIAQGRNGFCQVDVRNFHGALVVNKFGTKPNKHSGLTLGNIINGWGLDEDNDIMLYHEYGHTIQSRIWGVPYMGVAVASLFSAWFSSTYDHHMRWYEKNANQEAYGYFGQELWNNASSHNQDWLGRELYPLR